MYSPIPGYAELHCLSNFSFLRGASRPDELVQRASALGYSALALTDECSLAGAVRAHEAAKDPGLKLIVGSEVQLQNGPKLVILAADRESYGCLSELISCGRRRTRKGSYALHWADLDSGMPGCLVLLAPPPLVSGSERAKQACAVAERFAGRSWIAAELLCGPNDRARLDGLRELASASGMPLVAAGDVHMHQRSRRPLQDALTAIRVGRPVHSCGHALHPNAERHLRMRMRLAQLYPADLLTETVKIAERCNFSLEELRYEYPEELIPSGQTPTSYLRMLVEEGCRGRFPQGAPGAVRELIEREIGRAHV